MELVRDRKVVEWVCDGVKLEVTQPSTNTPILPPQPRSQLNHHARAALDKCLRTGVVSPLPPTDHTPPSCSFFAAPKSDSDEWRPILDCRSINDCLPQAIHFKMASINQLRPLLKPNWLLTKLDIKSAFNLIPLHKDSQKWTTFAADGVRFHYNALPMGVVSAPYTFTRILTAALAAAREHLRLPDSLVILHYVDDILLAAPDTVPIGVLTKELAEFLHSLGLIVAQEKCVMEPTNAIKFLGVKSMTFSLDQLKNLRHDAAELLLRAPSTLTIKQLAAFIGKATWAASVLVDAQAALRPLIRARTAALAKEKFNYAALLPQEWMQWTTEQHLALSWFLQTGNLRVTPIPLPQPNVTVEVDASPTAVAARLIDPTTNQVLYETAARLTDDERAQSQNARETMASLLLLPHLQSRIPMGSVVRLISDSVTHLAYLRKQGGPVTNLSRMVERLQHTLNENNWYLVLQHMAGTNLTETDALSRAKSADKTDYRVAPEFVQQLCQQWRLPLPSVDMFASRANTLCRNFFSYPYHEPQAIAADALSADWTHLPQQGTWWCFPPSILLPRLLQRLRREKPATVTALIVAPRWRTSLYAHEIRHQSANAYVPLPTQRSLSITAFKQLAGVVGCLASLINDGCAMIQPDIEVPPKLIITILGAFSATTTTTYYYAFRSFAQANPTDWPRPPVLTLQRHLQQLIDRGAVGATVHNTRTAISSMVDCIASLLQIPLLHIGEDPLITKTVSFARRAHPSQPPVTQRNLWTVEQLCDFINRTCPNNDVLSEEQLRNKAVILTSVSAIARAIDLSKVVLSSIRFTKTDVSFVVFDPKSHALAGHVGSYSQPHFLTASPSEQVCPLSALRLYFEKYITPRAATTRGSDKKLPVLGLFFVTGTLTPLSRERIANIRKQFLETAGFEETRSHSFRRAAATALLQAGMSPAEVMIAGGWSSAKVLMERYAALPHLREGASKLLRLPNTDISYRMGYIAAATVLLLLLLVLFLYLFLPQIFTPLSRKQLN